MNYTLEIYIPQFVADDTEFYKSAKKKFLNKSKSFSFTDTNKKEHQFNFTLISKSKWMKLNIVKKFNRVKNFDYIFYFKCTLEYEHKKGDDSILEFAYLFKNRIQVFLIALQLSHPGFIHNDEGKLFVNGHFYEDVAKSLTLVRESIEHIYMKIKWPKLEIIDINKTWNYIKEEMQGLEHMSDSPIQRALNAFSYLFGNNLNNMTLTLFWALIGIESLYVKGTINIMDQVNEKSQIFLGDLHDFKKILKKMYNFRSRLIHGDLNIPSNFIMKEDEIFQKHIFEEFDAASIASLVLLATLQKMILLNKKKIDFKYELINSK